MTSLAWPLEKNFIRRNVNNNAFGMVRNGGTRAHQGWDLYALPGTPCYAIADGTIRYAGLQGALDNMVLLEFAYREQTLYAAYCHLRFILVRGEVQVKRGEKIGYTGNTGNAELMRGEDQHLHFEIRTVKSSVPGLGGRLDPARLYGPAPIGRAFYEAHEEKLSLTGLGLKVKGVNVRERSK